MHLHQALSLMRLDKPIGIFLLLWPTLWSLWVAGGGHPDLFVTLIFIVGVVLMRSAGCIMNDVADRHVDKHVERTRERPLATGKVTVSMALALMGVLLLAAFLLVLQLNKLTILLAFVGAGLAVIYPFMKRFTHFPQMGLGFAFSWGVPMAFSALTDTVPAHAWILFLAAASWPMVYDTIYAMVDRSDDIKLGVKSTAIFFGNRDREMIAVLQILFLLLMCWSGFLFQLKIPYFLSLFVSGFFFIYQQSLIKDRDRKQCFKAFLNNHWVGMIIFLGIVMSYLS